MLQIVQNTQLAASFPELKYRGESHNYMIAISNQKITSYIPTNRTMINIPLNITAF